MEDTDTLGEVHLEGENTDILGTRGRLNFLAGGRVGDGDGDGHV